jgi:4-diphosphocytidyl-2-C-methyl-D-erythritol kinase
MILFPPAKINLGLNVLSKRDDGYHEIVSCLYELPICDAIEILPSDTFEFHSTGIPIDSRSEDNLCVKAYNLMSERYKISPVYIHLRKEIPMGAGLGGGSADATYILLGLNSMFDLKLSDEVLESLAAELGSDCPFFVKGNAQLAKGRGELLSNLNVSLKGKYLKLINPGIHIGTGEAYSNVDFDSNLKGYENLEHGDFSGLVNSFEKYAFKKYPVIEEIRNGLMAEGAVYAAMSGSGSSVFGIFDEKPIETGKHDFEKIVAL